MRYEFTPAAERALTAAANWRPPATSSPNLPLQLLLGLLEEPECRAAAMLAAVGVDGRAVADQWDGTAHSPTGGDVADGVSPLGGLPAELAHAIARAEAVLDDIPRPFEIATEHLLLALVGGEDEVATWLQQRGLTSEHLVQDIYELHGVSTEPIHYDEEPCRSTPQQLTPWQSEPPSETASVLRVLDAGANRAGEALRVIEDYLRFALDDAHLCRLCKGLRHELNAALESLPLSQRLTMRETQRDVGTEISTETEFARSGARDVLHANFTRLQETLRSLEEFAKISAPQAARLLEQIRYRAYTLQKAVGVTCDSRERLAAARLYVLIDGKASSQEFLDDCRTLVSAGVDVLQLRDKQLDDRTLLERSKALREITTGTKTLFVVNDRPDVAVLAAADGVHVGQEELTVHQVRRLVGPEMLVGVSTHNIVQARQAVLDGANYIGVGPTFPSATKQFDAFPGLDFVRQVAAEIRLPAFAIGGITAQNVSDVVAAGLSRIAVASTVTGAEDPRDVVIQLRAAVTQR